METAPAIQGFYQRLLRTLKSSLAPGFRTALWFLKMTIPISLGIAVLQYAGVVEWVSVQLSPLFRVMGLPGEASLVYITTALSNLYTGLAVIVTVGIDYRSAIILSVMGLICHNLIIETAIQRKAGASAFGMVILRIVASLVCGLGLNAMLPTGLAGQLHNSGIDVVQASSWGGLLTGWVKTIVPLVIKMFSIIMVLNVLQGVLREFRMLDLLSYPLRPVMRLFGLPLSTSFLWIICNVIGLAYGGAALIDELQRGKATKKDARLLNTHVAVSHSLLEDTSIFFSVGIPLFWLLVPRILLAVCAVWIQRSVRYIVDRYAGANFSKP